MSLHIVPVRARQAREFIATWHRHHRPPAGWVFTVGVADEDQVLRGVAIAGRPVARASDDGWTLEVTRTATDDRAPNGNSMLYGAARRAAKALGYRRLLTYTQASESGASLRAVGWKVVAERPARPGWDTPSRRRRPTGTENVPRTLWEAQL
ncbi:XF1762 family protein [Embleya sp. AB8]|uniref:XF1762 family protein n=1 Tax=Embleya sp. AB8 TaxID=3156304 RepID=UPI003C71333C